MKRRPYNANHGGVPDKFTPFWDRRVNARTVVCPECGAEVGAYCFERRSNKNHPVRRRMAIRLLNEELA